MKPNLVYILFYKPFYMNTFCVYVTNPRTINSKTLSMYIQISWALSKNEKVNL